MPRGHENGTNIDFAIAHLHGRIEQQIQQFSAETGISSHRVAERISTLLSPARAWVLDHMPPVQREAPGIHRPLEPLALAVDAHSSETQPAVKTRRGYTGKKVHPYWSKMTPEERAEEMQRRLLVAAKNKKNRKLALAKAEQRARASKSQTNSHAKATAPAPKKPAPKKQPLNTVPVLTAEQRAAKQRIYQARSTARKEGKPLPPLPTFLSSPTAN